MPRRVLRVARNLSFVRTLRYLLWALLVLAVVLSVTGLPLWALEEVQAGRLPRFVTLLPSILFGAFLAVFAVYRVALMRAGRYNPGKAFLQIGLGALVFMLLLPANWKRYAGLQPEPKVALAPLLRSPEPEVRAVACEALAHRSIDSEERRLARTLAETDPDPRVRAACAAVR